MKGINQQGQAVYYNVVEKHGKIRYQIQAASGQVLQGRDRQKRKSRTFAQEHQAAAWLRRNGYEICGISVYPLFLSWRRGQEKALAVGRGRYHVSQVFSGSGFRDSVLNSFQRGGQNISFVPPVRNGTKKYSSQISLVMSLMPTLRPISFRLMKNGSREGFIR